MGFFVLVMLMGFVDILILMVFNSYAAKKGYGTLSTAFLGLIVVWAFNMVFVSALDIKQANSAEIPASLKTTVFRTEHGTAFLYKTPKGRSYLITNWHVCLIDNWKGNLIATMEDGTVLQGEITKQSSSYDLCAALLPEKRGGLELAPDLFPKQSVHTRGYPGHILAQSSGITTGEVTWGSAFPIEMIGECPKEFHKEYGPDNRLYGCSTKFHSVLTTLYSRPGSSGSPVVDDSGKLVGVISSWHLSGKAEAGMVPFGQLRDFVKGL